MLHWFLHITGADNTSGVWYGFWSGFGSDLLEFTIVGTVWRKLNCHIKGCYRIGLHKVEGTPYITCKRHHPGIYVNSITAKHIKAEHNIHILNKNNQDDLLKEVHEHLLTEPEEET